MFCSAGSYDYCIKENDPNHLITVGWSNSVEATNLANKLDLLPITFIMI
jgi:hypothetical protein